MLGRDLISGLTIRDDRDLGERSTIDEDPLSGAVNGL